MHYKHRHWSGSKPFCTNIASEIFSLLHCVCFCIILRKCLYLTDNFIFAVNWSSCFKSNNFMPLIKKCYQLYFGCHVGNFDNSWAPNICCVSCVRQLTGRKNGTHHTSYVRRNIKITKLIVIFFVKSFPFDFYFCNWWKPQCWLKSPSVHHDLDTTDLYRREFDRCHTLPFFF